MEYENDNSSESTISDDENNETGNSRRASAFAAPQARAYQ
jgi:hypothetical protein